MDGSSCLTQIFKAKKEGLYFISISSLNWTFQTDSSPSIKHKSAEKRGDAERRKEECKPLLPEDNSSLMKDFNHLMKEHIQRRAKRNEGHHFQGLKAAKGGRREKRKMEVGKAFRKSYCGFVLFKTPALVIFRPTRFKIICLNVFFSKSKTSNLTSNLFVFYNIVFIFIIIN